MKIKSYKDLNVWQESISLVVTTYKITEQFPETERFCLQSQMRRSSVSIPSNIAEGYARKSNPDFIRFLRIAYGSASELETQLIISQKLSLIMEEEFTSAEKQIIVVKKMLNKFMKSLSTKH